MSSRLRRAVVALTALAVLIGGFAYASLRSPEWESRAQLVLHLGKVNPERVASLLDSFDRAGVSGTFVEHVVSDQTLRGAGSPPVTVRARAVPDTRVIDIWATGRRDTVQAGLDAVIRSAQVSQEKLKDPFRLGVLDSPGAPEEAGPATSLLLIATVLLAALAALFVFVVTRRPQATAPLRVADDAAADEETPGPRAAVRP